jgi:hypothetical protein
MRRLLPVVLAVALSAVACSSSVDETQEAYCDSVEAWVDALADVQALTATSTQEDSQAAVEAMESAFDGVVGASADYADAQLSDIESAVAEFESAIDDIPDSATLEEAAAARDDAYEALFASVKSTLDSQCPD